MDRFIWKYVNSKSGKSRWQHVAHSANAFLKKIWFVIRASHDERVFCPLQTFQIVYQEKDFCICVFPQGNSARSSKQPSLVVVKVKVRVRRWGRGWGRGRASTVENPCPPKSQTWTMCRASPITWCSFLKPPSAQTACTSLPTFVFDAWQFLCFVKETFIRWSALQSSSHQNCLRWIINDFLCWITLLWSVVIFLLFVSIKLK